MIPVGLFVLKISAIMVFHVLFITVFAVTFCRSPYCSYLLWIFFSLWFFYCLFQMHVIQIFDCRLFLSMCKYKSQKSCVSGNIIF